MKKISFLLIISYCIAFVSAQEVSSKSQRAIKSFIECVKSRDIDRLSSIVTYPLKRETPLISINDKEEFKKRFSQVFDGRLISLIEGSKIKTDWSEMGLRGLMFHNGEVWLDENGKIIAINYQSEYEKNKIKDLNRTEKTKLHESIKIFKKHICVLETPHYKIRIDEIDDNKFRYTSWPSETSMSTKPKVIINNGEYVSDGSGGNHSYIFKKDNYVYECSIMVLGTEDSAPARLTIYNGKKVELNEKAIIR